MNLAEFLDKENLHHAYLLEGAREEILESLKDYLVSIGVKTSGNPDFLHIHLDTFKIDDAREFKAYSGERSYSGNKKIFILSTNSFLLEAQNALLKMFEEPIPDTHFFLIVPDIHQMLPTIVSRFFVIRNGTSPKNESREGERFLTMPLRDRLDFIKDLLVDPEEEDEEGREILPPDSVRAKALNFLNLLESALHRKMVENFSAMNPSLKDSLRTSLGHILSVRKFLRMPGSSAKTMMESVALVIPSF